MEENGLTEKIKGWKPIAFRLREIPIKKWEGFVKQVVISWKKQAKSEISENGFLSKPKLIKSCSVDRRSRSRGREVATDNQILTMSYYVLFLMFRL